MDEEPVQTEQDEEFPLGNACGIGGEACEACQ